MLGRGAQGATIAKLLDFGLSAQTAPAAADPAMVATIAPSLVQTKPRSATSPLGFSGTVQYMAPEQMEGRAVDHRADIFAFGCVMYEMVAGRKAFEGTSPAMVIAAVMGADPPAVEALAAAPPVIDHVLRRCLEKDPDRRWQNMGDVTGELRWIASQPLTLAASGAAAAPGRRLTVWHWAGAAIAVLVAVFAVIPLLLLAGMRVLGRGSDSGPAPALRLEVTTPPTDDPSLALSPDGRQLAYVANQDRRPMLWVRALDTVEPRLLAGTDGARLPFWSPDGRSVGYFADGKVKRVDLASGTSLVVADAPNARGGSWGRDGTILYSPGVNSPIMRVSSDGGPATAVTTLQGRTGHRQPQFLPDGAHFLFNITLGTPATDGIYLGSLDGDPPVRLLDADYAAVYAPPNRLLAARQGVLLAFPFDPDDDEVEGQPTVVARGLDPAAGIASFSASSTGVLAYRAGGNQRRQLVWTNREGVALASIGAADDDATGSPELSPDERALAVFLQPRGDNEVGIIDLTRNLPRLLTNGPPADAHPLWDPDGQHVVFVSARTGQQGPVRMAADGSGTPQPLFSAPMVGSVLSWTRDRSFVLMRRGDEGSADLVAVSIDGQKPIPIAQTSFDETEGQFSPDGRWVAFVSNESGRTEVYIQSFPDGRGKTQISSTGGAQVRWAPNGNEIYYIAPDGQLMAAGVSVSGTAATPKSPVALFRTFLARGTNVIGNKPQYAVSRDGRFLLNSVVESASTPIVIAANWMTLTRAQLDDLANDLSRAR
jgi:Tol biopolymer transport system component